MAWKYVNPGDYRLLDVYSTGINGADSRFDTGMYFTGTADGNSPITVPTGTKEIWTCFSMVNSYDLNYFFKPDNKGITGIYANSSTIQIFVDGTKKKDVGNYQKYTEVYIHIRSNQSNGLFEIYVDGNLSYTQDGDVLGGNDLKFFTAQTKGSGDKMSCIIMQDYYLPKGEKIAILPATVTSSIGYTESDGTYSTTEANRTLWQIFDASNVSGNIVSFNIFPASISNDTSVIDKIKMKAKQGSTSVDIETTDVNLGAYSPVLTNPITGNNWTKTDFSTLEIGLETIKS